MTTQTPLRTEVITPNENISFPIGTILTVQKYYEHLRLCEIFGKHKKRGRDINIDWTSFVLYGEKCPLGKRGYSRDHRPDKKSGGKMHIFSNFNPTSLVILGKNQAIT